MVYKEKFIDLPRFIHEAAIEDYLKSYKTSFLKLQVIIAKVAYTNLPSNLVIYIVTIVQGIGALGCIWNCLDSWVIL